MQPYMTVDVVNKAILTEVNMLMTAERIYGPSTLSCVTVYPMGLYTKVFMPT